MANIHILNKVGADITIAAHVAIPATNNAAGFGWQAMLIRSGIGGTTRLPDGDGTGGTISTAEKAAIAAGSVYEQVEVLHGAIPVGAAAINTYLDGVFSAISTRVLTDLQDRLNFWGYTR